jgi:hypothetical protein
MSATPETLCIPTHVAHAGFDDHSFRGYRLFADLLGKTPTSAMIVLAITGRLLDAEECSLIDDLFVVSTVADPRIWPLKITRLVGAYGRLVPAFAAGHLSIDDAGIGPSTIGSFSRQLREIFDRVKGRVDDHAAIAGVVRELLAGDGRLTGFGVAFRSPDERVVAITGMLEARGRASGPYWQLVSSIASVVRAERRIEPNMAAAAAAALLDLGFEPEVIGPLAIAMFSVPFVANATEAAAEPAASLRVLPVDRVEYVGRAARESPRAAAATER